MQNTGKPKFTVAERAKIRARYNNTGITARELAIEYDVTINTIHRIIHRQNQQDKT